MTEGTVEGSLGVIRLDRGWSAAASLCYALLCFALVRTDSALGLLSGDPRSVCLPEYAAPG